MINGGLKLANREDRLKAIVLIVAASVVLFYGICAVTAPYNGDFDGHHAFGARLLAGEFLYAQGTELPYPPLWALFHLPASLLPLGMAKGLLYPLGMAGMVCLFLVLFELAVPHVRLEPGRSFWVVALAAFFSSRFLMRDLPELSVNTFIALLSWAGIYMWVKGRDWAGAASLGLATALKCTPAIFILYFGWKRQWKMFLASALFTCIFSITPLFVQGPRDFTAHMRAWVGHVSAGFLGQDPSVGTLGPENFMNMSLRPTLARYLMHLPDDHPGRVRHRLYYDVLSLTPGAAYAVIRVLLLAGIAATLWWWRRPVAERGDMRNLWEMSGASLLLLLYSPITWQQHCVSVLPAFVFISLRLMAGGRIPLLMASVLGAWCLFVLGLNREFVGGALDELLDSYHVMTFCIMGLTAIVAKCSVDTTGTGVYRMKNP